MNEGNLQLFMIAQNYQIRWKCKLEVSWFVSVEEEGVGSIGRAGGVGHVDVAELEVPESGDRDQEVPR